MEDKVPDGSEDLIIASLLESWSKYTSSWMARQHCLLSGPRFDEGGEK